MKLSDCKESTVLVIAQDVTNPKPDRRKTRQFDALVTWPKGTRLLFKRSRAHGEKGQAYLEAKSLYGILNQWDPGFDALIEACEPAPRNLANVLWVAEEGSAITTPRSILEWFLDHGRLTLDDIEQAVAGYEADDAAGLHEEA